MYPCFLKFLSTQMGTLESLSLHESENEILQLNWPQALISTLNDHMYDSGKILTRFIKQPIS